MALDFYNCRVQIFRKEGHNQSRQVVPGFERPVRADLQPLKMGTPAMQPWSDVGPQDIIFATNALYLDPVRGFDPKPDDLIVLTGNTKYAGDWRQVAQGDEFVDEDDSDPANYLKLPVMRYTPAKVS